MTIPGVVGSPLEPISMLIITISSFSKVPMLVRSNVMPSVYVAAVASSLPTSDIAMIYPTTASVAVSSSHPLA